MGGAVQPQDHTQIIVDMINLQEAGNAPRMRHVGFSQPTGSKMISGRALNLESGFSWEVIPDLEQKGHRVEFSLGPYGGYQAIKYNPVQKVYYGSTESRKDG